MSQAGAFPRMCETGDSTILNSLYCPRDSTHALSSYNNNRNLSQSLGTTRVPHITAVRAQPRCPVTGQPFSFTRLQSSPTPEQLCLPSHGTQSLCFPLWPSLYLSLSKIPPEEHKTNTAHRRGTCQTVMFYCSEQFTARGGSSWQAGLTTPSRDSSRNCHLY